MKSDNAFLESNFVDQRDNIYFRCVEDSNEPIMITDRKGQLVYVNPAWTKVYGYSREEALGQTPRLLRSRHQDKDFYAEMWKQIGSPTKGYWRGKLVNRAKDGREVLVHLTITPYRDASREIVGYMGIALDLTEQDLLERQLLHQEKLVTVGELTSGLAHEVGTPVGVIRGRAEMLAMDKSLPPSVANTLDIIIRQADRISSLINTLLRFTRSGVAFTELKPVNVRKVIDETTTLIIEKLRKRHIELMNEVDAKGVVWAEATKLEQVFINLILNSVYAIERAAAAGKAGPHFIKIQTRDEENCLKMLVEDSGMGVPESLRAKIFMPFFTTKPTGEGTGLGLSIVSRLAHEMDGHIDLDPTYTDGARFILTLKQQK